MSSELQNGQQLELCTVEQVRSSLEQTEKGKVSNAAANYKRVFQLDPLLKGAIRKNLLTERVDIVKPLGWYRDSPTLTDVDIKYLLLYFEENYGLTIEKKMDVESNGSVQMGVQDNNVFYQGYADYLGVVPEGMVLGVSTSETADGMPGITFVAAVKYDLYNETLNLTMIDGQNPFAEGKTQLQLIRCPDY